MIRQRRPMFFCERAFGMLFVLWGLVLLFDYLLPVRHGVLFASLETYMPGWLWGALFLSIGVSRWVAYKLRSDRWRIILSLVTLIVLVAVASIAVFTRMWTGTAPLACFVAYVSYWCHLSMLRDIRLGL